MAAQAGDALACFSPLPPARNGIADYTFMLLDAYRHETDITVYCEDALAQAPDGVNVRDPAQAFRHIGPNTPILHQIGNNGGHVFAMQALAQFGGVVALHDLSLLYLHELMHADLTPIFAGMQHPHGTLGRLYARHWRDQKLKTRANYVLFDMTGGIAERASGIIVHSEFARRKLIALHRGRVAEKIMVIPHFAPPLKIADRGGARARLGLDPFEPIILSSGFAAHAKRFDWLIAALNALVDRGVPFRFIHAGSEKAEEFPLSAEIAKNPALAARSTVTGYIDDGTLDAYIAAADVIVNLRFPSVGENSGTLARAFSAGKVAIVNDTAAYAELPRDAVVHVPVFGTVPALTAALESLCADAELRAAFGARARAYAGGPLAIDKVARAYHQAVMEGMARTADRPDADTRTGTAQRRIEIVDAGRLSRGQLAARLSGAGGPLCATLWFDTIEHLAARSLDTPGFVREILGPEVRLTAMGFLADGTGGATRIGLRILAEAAA